VTGLTLLNLHPLCVDDLFSIWAFAVMAGLTVQTTLMLGMGKGNWFWLLCVIGCGQQGDDLGAMVGSQDHADQSCGTEKCQY